MLSVIYNIGFLAIGFIFGMVLELCLDTKTIRELHEHNHKLSLENEQLKREGKHEVIEIIDNRVGQAVSFPNSEGI